MARRLLLRVCASVRPSVPLSYLPPSHPRTRLTHTALGSSVACVPTHRGGVADTGFFAEYADNPFDNDIGLFYNGENSAARGKSALRPDPSHSRQPANPFCPPVARHPGPTPTPHCDIPARLTSLARSRDTDFAFTDWEGIEMVAGDWFLTTYDFDLISYDFGYPYKYGGVSLYTDYYDGMVFFRVSAPGIAQGNAHASMRHQPQHARTPRHAPTQAHVPAHVPARLPPTRLPRPPANPPRAAKPPPAALPSACARATTSTPLTSTTARSMRTTARSRRSTA